MSGNSQGTQAGRLRTSEAIGALSRIDAGAVQAALGLARAGRVYDLGLEIDSRMPHNSESSPCL